MRPQGAPPVTRCVLLNPEPRLPNPHASHCQTKLSAVSSQLSARKAVQSMRGLAHFTVRRDREGDAPAEPLSVRPPHLSPRQGSAGASPSPTAHRPPPTAHRPDPAPIPIQHSAFRIQHCPAFCLLPSQAAQPVTRKHLPSRVPPLCTLCRPKPPSKTSRHTPIFPASDADFENNPNMQNKPRFVAMLHTKRSSFPASDSKLATRTRSLSPF